MMSRGRGRGGWSIAAVPFGTVVHSIGWRHRTQMNTRFQVDFGASRGIVGSTPTLMNDNFENGILFEELQEFRPRQIEIGQQVAVLMLDLGLSIVLGGRIAVVAAVVAISSNRVGQNGGGNEGHGNQNGIVVVAVAIVFISIVLPVLLVAIAIVVGLFVVVIFVAFLLVLVVTLQEIVKACALFGFSQGPSILIVVIQCKGGRDMIIASG